MSSGVSSGLRRLRRGPKASITPIAVAMGVATLAGGVVAIRSATRTTRADLSLGTPAPEVPVTPMDLVASPSHNSPALAIDPTDARFVAMAGRVDAPGFSCALHLSGNGGRGWISARPFDRLPPGADRCYAPEVAFDREGRLLYLFVGLHGGGNTPMGVFLVTSTDRGRTFSAPLRVLGPRNYAVRMAIDPDHGNSGRIHLVWLNATSEPPLGGLGPPPNPILAAYSDDGGRTFSKPLQVSDATRERVVAPALALGDDGIVHVAYYDLEEDVIDYQGLEGPTWEGTWSVIVATSKDGGRRFSRGVVVEPSVVPTDRPMLIYTMPPPAVAADREGHVCAGWPDGRLGDADVFVACSGNEGRRFGPARRVNDDAVDNGRTQTLPTLTMSEDERLHVLFLDRRADPDNRANHVYYAASGSDELRFGRNVRLTEDPSDSRIGQQYANVSAQGQFEFGSRLALLARGTRVLAAWPDTRNSRPNTTAQDLFTTELGGPSGDSGRTVGAVATLPPVPPVVDVAMDEFRFSYQGPVPAGRVVFRIRNAGSVKHRLTLLPLEEDVPPIEAQLRGAERRLVKPFAGVPVRRPGKTGTFAVDLAPGRRYAIICFLRDDDGRPHALKGMTGEFRTVATGAKPT